MQDCVFIGPALESAGMGTGLEWSVCHEHL